MASKKKLDEILKKVNSGTLSVKSDINQTRGDRNHTQRGVTSSRKTDNTAVGNAGLSKPAKVTSDVSGEAWTRATPSQTKTPERNADGSVNLGSRFNNTLGQYGAGNIDLRNRPQYKNEDGSISTVDGTSFNIDGKEVLLPAVWMKNGNPYHSYDDNEIIQHYYDTGEYLGKFDSVQEANEYAQQLHLAQEYLYSSPSQTALTQDQQKKHTEIQLKTYQTQLDQANRDAYDWGIREEQEFLGGLVPQDVLDRTNKSKYKSSSEAKQAAQVLGQQKTSLLNQNYENRSQDILKTVNADKNASSALKTAQSLEDLQRKIRYELEWSSAEGIDRSSAETRKLGLQYGLTEAECKNIWSMQAAITKKLKQAKAAVEKTGVSYDDAYEYLRRQELSQEAANKKTALETKLDDNGLEMAKHTGLSVLANMGKGVDYVAGIAGNWGHNDERNLDTYRPMNSDAMSATNYANTVRGKVGSEIQEDATAGLKKLGASEGVAQFGGEASKFLYDTGMSIVDNAAQMAVAGVAGAGTAGTGYIVSGLMGTGAAADQMKNILDNGGTNDQAMVGGFAAGVAEALFEKVSIDALLAPKNVTNFKSWAKEALKQGGVEASEEVCTELANMFTDALIRGQDSDFQRAIAFYQTEEGGGLSLAEAKKKAYLDAIGQVALAGLGGFISGGVMQGFKGGVGLGNYNSTLKKVGQAVKDSTGNTQNTSHIAEIQKGLAAAEGSKARQLAEQAQKELDSKKTVSNKLLGKLAVENQNELRDVMKAASPEAAAKAMTELRSTGNVSTATMAELRASAKVSPAASAEVQQTEARAQVTQAENPGVDVLDAAATLFLENGITKKPVKAKEKAEIVQALIDGKKVENTDINKLNPENPKARELFTQLTGVQFPEGKMTQEQLYNLYRSAHDVAVQAREQQRAQQQAQEAAFQQSQEGMTQPPVGTANDVPIDSPEGRADFLNINQIFDDNQTITLGGQTLNYQQFADQIRHAPVEVIPTEDEIRDLWKQQVERQNGRYSVDHEQNPVTMAVVAEEARRAENAATAKWMQDVLKPLGVQQVIVDYGTMGDNENAYIDSNGILHFNGDRMSGANAMIWTLGHELVHHAEFRTGETGNVSEDIIDAFSKLNKAGALSGVAKTWMDNVDGRVSEIKKAYQNHEAALENGDPDKVTDAYCREELAGDLMRIAFTEDNLLMSLAGEKPSLLIRSKEALARLKAQMFGNEQIRATVDARKALDEMEKRFEKALKTSEARAIRNEPGAFTDSDGNLIVENDGKGSSRLSLSTYEESGKEILRTWLDDAVDNKQLSREDADDILNSLDTIYQVCKGYKDRYAPFSAWSDAKVVTDSNGNPVFSVVKANGDYSMNLDFSLVCKKRRTLDAVLNEMVRRGLADNVNMGQENIVRINDIIRKYGFEAACSLCFVDAKRFRQAKVADDFVKMYNDQVNSLIPKGSDLKASYFNFGGNSLIDNTGRGIETLSDTDLDFTKVDKILKTKGERTVEYKIAKHLKENAADRRLCARSDFLSTRGFNVVKKENPAVLSLFNSKKGSGGPKSAESDVQYLNEILASKTFDPEKAYAVGGVRIQSFSDFVPRMVFDYVQMFADMSAKQLPGHAYTKEELFVKMFGLTGLKINMSLIPKVVDGGVAAGLDADGNYVWADESFDYDIALEIQSADGYSKNCGTIAVGVSDEHIRKLLADPNIRMVIPYHKSGLNPEVARMNKIDQFTDYTDSQNTRHKNGNKLDKDNAADKRLLAEETNFNQRLHEMGENGDPQAVVEEYVKWCEDNDLLPKFDQFVYKKIGDMFVEEDGHKVVDENYYKLIEDFTVYDGGAYSPQTAVKMTFPTEDSAFGPMSELIKRGLEEDAILEGKRSEKVGPIVDEIAHAMHTDEWKNATKEPGKKRSRKRYSVEAENESTDDSGMEFYDTQKKYSVLVEDKDTLDFLNNQKTIKTYKTMQLVDGKLYPPMASRINGKFEDASELGKWEQATEHPELIKNGNKFKLDKGKGNGSIEAAYNPYMHSSNLVINDQFTGAYTRDNLVTVECEVPVSEVTSGYHAEYAKDSVGWHSWHTGTVAGQIRKEKGIERQVFLSRWIKPVRIVPDSEVASIYKTLLDGTDIAVPDNVVTPALRNELQKAGVKLQESGKVRYSITGENDAVENEKAIRKLENEIDDINSKLDLASVDGLSEIEVRRLRNQLTKSQYELDQRNAAERKAAVRTSLQTILDNLDNYRAIDLESIANQLTDNVWDDVETLSTEELKSGIREIIQERAGDMSPLEMQSPKFGVYVRKPSTSAGVRYSVIDSDYMAAVERGDMETAQKMVDEAANAAFKDSVLRGKDGSLIKVYHGSPETFNVFRGKEIGGTGNYFSPWESFAIEYGDTRAFYLNLTNPAMYDYDWNKVNGVPADKSDGFIYVPEDMEGGIDQNKVGDTEIVVYDSNKIKSADPVTYDDNGNVIPLSERFQTTSPDIRYSITPEFEQWYKENFGGEDLTDAQLQRRLEYAKQKESDILVSKQAAKTKQDVDQRYKDLTAWMMYHERKMREQRQTLKDRSKAVQQSMKADKKDALQKQAEIHKAELAVARDEKVKALKDKDLAWRIYSQQQARNAAADKAEALKTARKEANAEKAEAVRTTKEVERAKAEVQHDADMMAMKREAAKRLRIKEDAYQQKAEQRKENQKLKRNAAKQALRDSKRVAQKRAEAEVKQGAVDTIRKNPASRSAVEKLQERASQLRTLGRSAYRTFVNQALHIDELAKRQVEGTRASTLVTVLGGANDTVSTIYKNGLVDRAGNTIGESMKDVFLCWDVKGKKVDQKKQALLQDYMLHQHNVDRMSFVDRARTRLETFEQENPWLSQMDTKEFARLVAMTDAEIQSTGKQEAHDKAVQYARLLHEYDTAQNKPIFGDSDGNAVTADTSREIVQQYLSENPWLEEKAQGIYEWWDKFMRTWAVGDSITETEYNTMRELYPHYVPTYRADKKGVGAANFVGANGASIGKAVKKAKGGMSEVLNIEDSFSNLVSKIVRLERTNELYMNMIDSAMLDNDGTFSDMIVFDWDWQDGQYGKTLEVGAILNGDLDARYNDAETAGLSKVGQDRKLTAWHNGRQYSAYVSEDLFKSIANVTGTVANDIEKAFIKAGNALTGPMKTAITGINPFFAVRNLSRDLPTAITNSISGMAFPKYWAQAAAEIAKNSENWQHFQALGGTNATYYNDQNGFVNGMEKGDGIASKIVGKMGAFNEVTEAQTRFAEYLATIDRLGDTYENRLLGIKNAAEVTVDFSRKGRAGKLINAWVPYWNPAVQGVDKVVRSVIDSPDGSAVWKQAARTVGRASMTTVLLEAILYAVLKGIGRYDDWEELDDRTKDTYYCIPYGKSNTFIKVPKNREWGAILGTPFMRLLEYANGRENPFENYIETSLEPNFLPGQILAPREGGGWQSDAIGLSQALDLQANKDFAGRTIVPYSLEKGSKELQYNEDTSWFAKQLGALIHFSPMQIDYIITDYFGNFGDIAVMATSDAIINGTESLPEKFEDVVKNQFVVDNRKSNYVVSKYYDTLEQLDTVVQDRLNQLGSDAYKETVEYQTKTAMDKLFGKQISELNKQVREAKTNDERMELKGQIAELAEQALSYYDDCMSGKVQNPVLDAQYASLPSTVAKELERLDGYSTDYRFKPTGNPSAKYTDPKNKNKEYVLTDEQKDKFKEIYQEQYAQTYAKVIGSSKYKSASDEKKANLLENARDDVLEDTKNEFFKWLKKTGAKSTAKKK